VALGSIVASSSSCPSAWWPAGSALLSLAALPYGLAIALLSTALPYHPRDDALTKLPARTFGVLMSIEPAFGALAAGRCCKKRPRCGPMGRHHPDYPRLDRHDVDGDGSAAVGSSNAGVMEARPARRVVTILCAAGDLFHARQWRPSP